MATQKIRIKLKSYDHSLIDQVALRIVDVANKNGCKISGPIPLPTDREVITVIRSPHKDKDSREQFETRTHKRIIDILSPSSKAIKVSWKSVSGANGYEVYSSTSKSGTYKKIKTTSSLSYTNSGLKKGKTYYYKVRAYKTFNGKKVYGSYSSVKSTSLK